MLRDLKKEYSDDHGRAKVILLIVILLFCAICVAGAGWYFLCYRNSGDGYDKKEFEKLLPKAVKDDIDISETGHVVLKYGDIVSADDLMYDEATGESTSLAYEAAFVINGDSTSKQVKAGIVQDVYDEKNVTVDSDKIKAVGTGKAVVVLSPSEDVDKIRDYFAGLTRDSADRSLKESVKGCQAVLVYVDVEPAVLTQIYIGGQSNAEGICSAGSDYNLNNTVAVPEGQSYASYFPKDIGVAKRLTGIEMTECTEDNVETFVPGNLIGNTSIAGTELKYPVNTLNEDGAGKHGMDGAAAYEWNRLTGDKVWLANIACSGTSMFTWSVGQWEYNRASKIMEQCYKVYNAEIEAGHYTRGHIIMLWQQGSADRKRDSEAYIGFYKDVREAFDENYGIEYWGVIPERAGIASALSPIDIYMTGPRIAQYYLAYSNDYDNVYIVSDENIDWIRDDKVKEYFANAYPEGEITYNLRPDNTVTGIPDCIKDVRADKHYTQLGHNENGINAVKSMYRIIEGDTGSAETAVFKDCTGNTVEDIYIGEEKGKVVVPYITPFYCSKDVEILVEDESICSFDLLSMTVKPVKEGDTRLIVKSAGKVMGSVNIHNYVH